LKGASEKIQMSLRKHVENLDTFFKNASDFLVRCQIADPYVHEGTLKGAICPWEIGVADNQGLLILEDFHDTLEAIWVWCYYTKISGKNIYQPNIEMGWNYVSKNSERHIPENTYDCSHLILCGSLYEKIFKDNTYYKLIETAGNGLAHYFKELARKKDCSDWMTESCWAWWMASCLGSVAESLRNNEWSEAAKNFVKRTVVEEEKPFCSVGNEPRHRGPGDHECFSCNANKVLALMSCYPSEITRKIITDKFLPLAPKRFVRRKVDENAWNANVAMALGKSYLLTGEEKFLHSYFAIMNELRRRDIQNSSALPRSQNFPARESWVTFFYAYAYAAVIETS